MNLTEEELHASKPEFLREKGIDFAFSVKDDIPLPKLVETGCKAMYNQLPDPQSCPFQGFNYDDDEDCDRCGELMDDCVCKSYKLKDVDVTEEELIRLRKLMHDTDVFLKSLEELEDM